MTRHTLTCGDAFGLLADMPSKSVDLIITDPPYESLEKHRSKGTTTRLKVSDGSSNEWFQTIPNSSFPKLFQEFYRILRNDRHFYLICDQETMFIAKPIAEAAGFRFWKPIIWDKVTIGMGYHYRCRYEVILFFEKGKRKLTDLGTPDVLAVKRVRKGYPTEKPVELLEILCDQSAVPGETVFDPFMGSGSTGVAAARLGMTFRGNDLKQSAVDLATTRLAEVQARMEPTHATPCG